MSTTTSGDITVMVVEDRPALREALDILLARAGCRVVATAATVQDGIALYRKERPTVVVAGHAVGGESGAELVEQLLAVDPGARVVVFTGSSSTREHLAVLRCRARGLALKGSRFAVLLDAVRTVAAGGTFVDVGVRVTPMLRSAA